MFTLFGKIVKKTSFINIIISMLIVVSINQVQAEIPSYNLKQDRHTLVDYLHQSFDSMKPKSLENISNLTEKEWKLVHLKNSDLLILPGANWFAFDLLNSDKNNKHVYVQIANQVRIKGMELYIRDSEQLLIPKTLETQPNNTLTAKISVAPYSKKTLYLLIVSPTQLRSTVQIYSDQVFIKNSNTLQFKQGMAIGGLFCLSIAVLLLFFATGNRTIFILFGYFLSNTFMLSTMLGFSLYYLLPHLPELKGLEIPILTASSLIFLLLFTVQLFNLKTKLNSTYQSIRILYWALLLYMPMSLQLSISDNIKISMALFILVTLLLISLGTYLHKCKSRLALLYTSVMTIQLGIVLFVITSINWFDIGFIVYRNLFYGVLFWLNCLFVIFIMSRQYRYQLKDKQQAQRQALNSAMESERTKEELLKLRSKDQEELENRVQERTLELNIALQELEEANHELEQKNTLDALTGLFNRRFYDQKILAEYRRSKRNLTPLSLVIIDIDHFKSVNDTYGHLAGDECLVWISKHIKKSLKRSADMAFRYGGEEFCLILPDTDAKGAMIFAEHLRKSIIQKAYEYNDISIPLTISNGIFTYIQQDNIMPEQIFSCADQALYQAKHEGRNQTREFSQYIE